MRGFKRALRQQAARDRFLAAYAELAPYPTISEAATAARVHRATIYRWLKRDPELRRAMERASEKGYQKWRKEVYAPAAAQRRAAEREARSAGAKSAWARRRAG